VGHSPGITHSVTAALAFIVTLALSFMAYVIGQQYLNIQQAVAYSHVENVKTAMMEKVSLVYWDFSGRAWIQNIGEIPVTIVKIYVDDQEVWASSGKQPLTIQPGQTVKIDLPYRGNVLAVETDTGSIHILRR
jgi:archaellum component FlaF (FlaF/FlaG flagellin family)